MREGRFTRIYYYQCCLFAQIFNHPCSWEDMHGTSDNDHYVRLPYCIYSIPQHSAMEILIEEDDIWSDLRSIRSFISNIYVRIVGINWKRDVWAKR